MKIRAFVTLAALLGCGAMAAQEPAQPAAPADQLHLGNRMVQAVQYPYDQKVKFDRLFSTGRVKDISGSAEILRKKTIAVQVDLDAPPASQLKPEYKGYVVWALAPGGKFVNLGSIERKGKLKTTVADLPAFGIVISAEPDLKAASPTDAVLESGMPDARKRFYPIYRVFYKPKN